MSSQNKLENSLRKSFIFDECSNEEKSNFISLTRKQFQPIGLAIICQGYVSNFLYIIEEGIVDVFVDNEVVATLRSGDLFGELAMLKDDHRCSATCTAVTDCTLWKVNHEAFKSLFRKEELTESKLQTYKIFKRIVYDYPHISNQFSNDAEHMLMSNSRQPFRRDIANTVLTELQCTYNIICRIPYLFDLDNDTVTKINNEFNLVHYDEGQQILNKDEGTKVFHILREGSVLISMTGDGNDVQLNGGNYFGVEAFACEEVLSYNVTTLTPCSALILSYDDLEKVLTEPLDEIIGSLAIRNIEVNRLVLMKIPLFVGSASDYRRAARQFTQIYFSEDEILLRKGEPVSHQGIFIVQRGLVSITYENDTVKLIYEQNYFGDNYILDEKDSISKEMVYIMEPTVCAFISKEALFTLFGPMKSEYEIKMQALRMCCWY